MRSLSLSGPTEIVPNWAPHLLKPALIARYGIWNTKYFWLYIKRNVHIITSRIFHYKSRGRPHIIIYLLKPPHPYHHHSLSFVLPPVLLTDMFKLKYYTYINISSTRSNLNLIGINQKVVGSDNKNRNRNQEVLLVIRVLSLIQKSIWHCIPTTFPIGWSYGEIRAEHAGLKKSHLKILYTT